MERDKIFLISIFFATQVLVFFSLTFRVFDSFPGCGRAFDRENAMFCGSGCEFEDENARFCGCGRAFDSEKTRFCGSGRAFVCGNARFCGSQAGIASQAFVNAQGPATSLFRGTSAPTRATKSNGIPMRQAQDPEAL